MILALILARGGSKRIPGKNIRSFHGKPLIAYTIEACFAAGCFDRVAVSTDSEEIAAIALQYGAEVPFMRSAELASDHATTRDALLHGTRWFDDQGEQVDAVCCLYPNPFILPVNIQKSLVAMQRSKADKAMPVAAFRFPIQRAQQVNDEGYLNFFFPEHASARSQDLEEAYHDAGQFYWLDGERFLSSGDMRPAANLAFVLPTWQVQDLDTLEDWENAELMYEAFRIRTEGD